MSGTDRDLADRLVAPPLSAGSAAPEVPAGRLVDVSGAPLWVIDTGGGGDAVVLLHAAVGSSRLWAYQIAALAHAGYRVVAFDRPGHGGSPAAGESSGAPAAEQCLELLRILDLGRVHLVGAAQGGRIATEVALAAPARPRTLVLVASSGGVRYEQPPGTPPLMPKGFTSLPAWFTELGAPYRSVDPEGTQRWIALGNEHTPGLTAPVTRIEPAALGRLRLPVLLIGGDADGFTPPPALRRLRLDFPSAQVTIIPECGHSPHWERPDLCNGELLRFLSRAAAGR
jgi:pimeloyl-ACP methyl ester carboxylesterase